jgi:broad specificity phosphatase PhoE
MYARICPPFLKELAQLGIHHRMGGYVLEERAKNLSIAVFSHGGTLNVLLSFILGIPPFPVGCFGFELTGLATVRFNERNGIFYPMLSLPALTEGISCA